MTEIHSVIPAISIVTKEERADSWKPYIYLVFDFAGTTTNSNFKSKFNFAKRKKKEVEIEFNVHFFLSKCTFIENIQS